MGFQVRMILLYALKMSCLLLKSGGIWHFNDGIPWKLILKQILFLLFSYSANAS